MDLVFTPASILDLLNQIDELKDYDIGITETFDNKLQLQIGESIYEFELDDATEVTAPEDVVDSIESINEEAYADLVSEDGFEDTHEVIESGLLKEAVKTLLLGGAIRMIKKLL